jgi:3-deoxy-D-manno-octulosonate 8-phosphate phosphatase KdsC-like HAD superfamily phosphatase
MSKLSAAARARKIKLLLFDVDGVLTDGKIYLFPVPSEGQHQIVVEAKGFSAHDGAGISLARLGGLKAGLITRRNSTSSWNTSIRALETSWLPFAKFSARRGSVPARPLLSEMT